MTRHTHEIARFIFIGLISFSFLALLTVRGNETTIAMNPSRHGNKPWISPVYRSSTPINFTIINMTGMGLSSAEQYLLASVQGIVNKNGTNLFVIASSIDQFWLDYFNSSGMYVGKLVTFPNVTSIVKWYKNYFDGMILFDINDPDEANMATGLCGANRSLLVDQTLCNAVKTACNVPVKYNMTGIVASNGLVNRTMKYAYAFDHFYQYCNHSALAYYAEDAPYHARSFFIANNIFTIWRVLYVHSAPDAGNRTQDSVEELAFVDRILRSTPYNIPIYGYPWPDGSNEGRAVTEISKYGKYVMANDWFFNLEFLAKMQLPAGYTFRQNRSAIIPPLQNKIYVTGFWSDGDNIQYVPGYMKNVLWDNRRPGLVPTGWTISSQCCKLIPWVMKYYYDHASSTDYFVAALSGKGYMYPREMNDTALRAYYADVPSLLERTDLTEIHTMNIGSAASTVASLVNVTAIFDGYGGDALQMPNVYNGIPVLHSMYLTLDSVNRSYEYLVHQVKSATMVSPVFVFFNILCWDAQHNHTQYWNDFATKLQAAGIEVVRPDVFARLVRKAHVELPQNLSMVVPSIICSAGLLGVGIIITTWSRKFVKKR